jgi:ElaB/YqjD/DUF883 family membrane-anchored ribosome-binding protein
VKQAELQEWLRVEEQRRDDINMAIQNLEELLQQSHASKSDLEELNTTASQSLRNLQNEVQVQTRMAMGVVSDTACRVEVLEDRLIGMLDNSDNTLH